MSFLSRDTNQIKREFEDLRDEQKGLEQRLSLKQGGRTVGHGHGGIQQGGKKYADQSIGRVEKAMKSVEPSVGILEFGAQPSSDVMEAGELQESVKRQREQLPIAEGDKKRARRMFGSLLGTLARAQKEGEAAKETREKREEIQKKAEERRRAEQERLLKEREEQLLKERAMDIERARQLEHQMRIKRLELQAASRIESRRRHHTCGFLLTSIRPGIYWRPKIEGPMTEALRKGQAEEMDKWSAGILEALEADTERIKEERKNGSSYHEQEVENMDAENVGREARNESKAAPMEEGSKHIGSAPQGAMEELLFD